MPAITPNGKGKKLLTEINMVPFIDVVLVLLIIFMIMSPFLAQSQISINLPKAISPSAGPEDNPIKVQVTRDGIFYLQGQRVGRGELEPKLRLALRTHSSKALLVEADKDVAFESVVWVLDMAKRLQASKVGVGVRTTPS